MRREEKREEKRREKRREELTTRNRPSCVTIATILSKY
jgi:hypothetical protein